MVGPACGCCRRGVIDYGVPVRTAKLIELSGGVEPFQGEA